MVSNPYNGFPANYRDKQGRKVYNAFKTGKARRPIKCVMCDRHDFEGALVHAHNEDYHRPLNYVGLCFPCHMAVHRRFKDLPTWYIWRDNVAKGWQPPKIRDYRVFIKIWEALKPYESTEPKNLENWCFRLPDYEPDLYSGRTINEEETLF